MVRNRVSNDLDHVQDQPTTTTKAKTAPPKPWPMPTFKPLKIKNGRQYGLGKLPSNYSCDAYSIFGLFFTDEVLERLVKHTNDYAARHEAEIQENRPPHARPWFSTTVKELRAFLATYIYMGVTEEAPIEAYWNTDPAKGAIHPLVSRHISEVRWQQIDRFFRISSYTPNGNTFEKVDELSEHLRTRFKLYWEAGTHLTVDETMQRFLGRSDATVNIPSKPVPEGFKIWVLANAGYVLDWLYHAKGENKGPVDLNIEYTKNWGFSKTEAVVLDLLQQEGIADDFRHVVWLDNLFTSTKLLSKLCELGFGGAGTVRTCKTKRETIEENKGSEAQKNTKEKNKGMHDILTDLKLKYGVQLEWGSLFGCLSEDGKVLQFAWKDQQVVLFASTVSNGRCEVKRMRKRPSKTSTNARTSRAVFGDLPMKELSIPDFIDLYNHFMNGVDVADQLRSYYTSQRVHLKNWKPLWHFLLDTTVCNCFKIASTTPQKPYTELRSHVRHRAFNMELINGLYENSERLNAPARPRRHLKPNKLSHLVSKAPAVEHEELIRMSNTGRPCEACNSINRTANKPFKRKALTELSNNSVVGGKRRKRVPRSIYGCGLCRIHLCNNGRCWNEHIEAIQ